MLIRAEKYHKADKQSESVVKKPCGRMTCFYYPLRRFQVTFLGSVLGDNSASFPYRMAVALREHETLILQKGQAELSQRVKGNVSPFKFQKVRKEFLVKLAIPKLF